MLEEEDDLHAALDHSQQAIQHFRSAADATGEALALNSAGWCHDRLGSREQALELCVEALGLQQAVNDRYGAATTWDSLGFVYHHLGDLQQAVVSYRSSLTLRQEGGERYGEATTLIRLGDAHLAVGAPPAAIVAWQRADRILGELQHPDCGTGSFPTAADRAGPGASQLTHEQHESR